MKVHVYMRGNFANSASKCELLMMDLDPDFCLDEVACLVAGLNPKYVSVAPLLTADATWLYKSNLDVVHLKRPSE